MFYYVLLFMSLCAALYLTLRQRMARGRGHHSAGSSRRLGCHWHPEGPGTYRCQSCGALAGSHGRGNRPRCASANAQTNANANARANAHTSAHTNARSGAVR